ncbi:hypothetical protein AB4J90_11245 [Geobacillus thermodenitrificans]|uniref:hypothetical protein n=1 Tax=Geobacillus thermodenitrificans TaxID=33940 RepID=UPI0034C600AD
MEIAIACQDIEQVLSLKEGKTEKIANPIERDMYLHIRECLSSRLGHFSPARLYFGSEFCQYRIPKTTELAEAYAFARKRGYGFTFVTPYVPERGMKKLLPLLEWLQEEGDDVEVVVNDWGMLYMVASSFPSLRPVVGRLLNKMIRDPRVAYLYDRPEAPLPAKEAFFRSSFDVATFQTFFQRLNVKAIEYDSFLQPVYPPALDVPISLHLGFAVIATGRACLVGTLHQLKEHKFKGTVPCKQQCCHYIAELVNKRTKLSELPVRVFQKGNTSFYQQTPELVEKGIDWAEENGVWRLVVHFKIPV